MNILRVKDENGNWVDIPAIKGAQGPQGPKGDKGDMGDLTPEAEALRDEMKVLADKTEESADRAEEAAQKLEGGLVLRKGEGDDSIVQAITTESGNPNRDNKPIATGFAAVGLGEFNEVSGDNSFACNYVNLVTGNRSFAANEDNKVYGKRSAAFGWKNTIGVNPESPDAPENPEETANIFSCGYQNSLTGRNSFSAGNVNAVKAVNGFAAGKANTLEATAQNGAVFGEQNKVSGYAAFVAGGYNDVAGEYAAALGYKNIVSGGQSFAIGADNEVSGTNDFVGGYNNEVLGDYGFVVGANNIVAKGVQNAAVFGVKNEVPAGGGCVVNGSFNTLSGVYANAFGSRNVVSGNAAFAAGQYLQAIKEGQSVFGRYNSPSDEALFLVGNGTSDTDRKNAFEVHNNHIVIGGIELPKDMLKYHYDGYASIEFDDGAFNDQCIAWFNALGDGHFGRYVLSKGGQGFFVEIYRTTAQYGVIKTTIYYASGGADISYGSVIAGEFTGFSSISFKTHNHDDRYYTEEEIDEKFANVSSGGSAGVLREFSDANATGSYTTTGNKSKFYIITLIIAGKTYSLTVDYKSVSAATGKIRYIEIPGTNYDLKVEINSGDTVTFDLGGVGTIDYITGYY